MTAMSDTNLVRDQPVVGAARGAAVPLVQQVAATDSTVLLLGETGTGKELFASLIHDISLVDSRRWCASIAPPSPPRSSRASCSAASGARSPTPSPGRSGASSWRTARRSSSTRLATCRRKCRSSCCACSRIGRSSGWEARRAIPVNVRVMAATHRNLEERVADGSFRSDLFYRLNVFPIQVPPLRERTEDIPLLVWQFVGGVLARRSASGSTASRRRRWRS